MKVEAEFVKRMKEAVPVEGNLGGHGTIGRAVSEHLSKNTWLSLVEDEVVGS